MPFKRKKERNKAREKKIEKFSSWKIIILLMIDTGGCKRIPYGRGPGLTHETRTSI